MEDPSRCVFGGCKEQTRSFAASELKKAFFFLCFSLRFAAFLQC